jgi:carboxynorspermidine decarboxylase
LFLIQSINSINFILKQKKQIIQFHAEFRVNPEFSDVGTDLYNPSAAGSRLGVGNFEFPEELPEGIEGIHFHVLCESDSLVLKKYLENLEFKFGNYLHQVKWVNMGGGHLMTRKRLQSPTPDSIVKEFQREI